MVIAVLLSMLAQVRSLGATELYILPHLQPGDTVVLQGKAAT